MEKNVIKKICYTCESFTSNSGFKNIGYCYNHASYVCGNLKNQDCWKENKENKK